jgi:plastocyanin
MKTTIIFLLLILATSSISFATTHIVTNSGFSFSPSSLTITLGDTVNFVLASIHTAREVDVATWNANGTTSNGGFDLPNGGGTVVLNQVGIHYYVCVPHASLGMKGTITVNSATDVKNINETIPDIFILKQNYPNPFNPTTTISFKLQYKSLVSLKIFDALGREVSTLVNEELSAGDHFRQWTGVNMSTGVYFYRLQAGSFIETKKLLLLK